MTKTMAEVLAEHHSKQYDGELGTVFCLDPTCAWDAQAHNFAIAADVFAQHQEYMLTAAGFGLVADAKSEALVEAMEKVRQELFDMSNDDGLTMQHRAAYRDASRAIYTVLTRRTTDAHD